MAAVFRIRVLLFTCDKPNIACAGIRLTQKLKLSNKNESTILLTLRNLNGFISI